MAEHPNAGWAGQVAVVTGGGTGIGQATCRALALRGVDCVVVYSRSETEARETVAGIEASGGRAWATRADVTDPEAVDNMVRATLSRYGRLDYLVNNAGITRQLPFDDLQAIEDPMWDALFAANVKGSFLCSRAAAPHLARSPTGAIVNVGSIAGETGYGSSIPYAVSKSAVHGLTRSLARALAPDIRVNCVAPGAVATRWWEGNEEKMMALSGALPLQRISTPEDIAETIVMLLAARSMTGQIVRAENGQTL